MISPLASLRLFAMVDVSSTIKTLYHNTSPHSALQILTEGAFKLPLSETNESESRRHIYKLYYLSTARSLASGYISDRSAGLGVVNNAVTFVIDVQKLLRLNRGIKIKPVEYWGLDKHGRSLGSGSEQEERIYSDKRVLNVKGCLKVLLTVRDSKYERLFGLRQVYAYCIRNKIPVKLFTHDNLQGFKLQREKKEDRAKAVQLLLAAKREHGYSSVHKGKSPYSSKTATKYWERNTPPNERSVSEIDALRYLVDATHWLQVPPKVRARYLDRYSSSLQGNFKQFLHNLRADGTRGSDDPEKLDKLLRKTKSKSIPAFFAKLEAKWKRLRDEYNAEEDAKWKKEQEAKQ
ncbi:hypothetical protein [Rhizobium phage RHEph12]|nr:hypothetical protein [Rhizobium phage RHEph12]